MYAIEIIAGPAIASPSVADLAAHVGLGDLYDAADAAAVLAAAAAIARERTGRSVGQTQYRLVCRHESGEFVFLPYPGQTCAIDAVSIDGEVVEPGRYELARKGAWFALRWLAEHQGDRLVVEFTAGGQDLTGLQRQLVLVQAADLFRSRESFTPGQMSPAAVTAEWLASLDKLVYAGPYAYEEVLR